MEMGLRIRLDVLTNGRLLSLTVTPGDRYP